MRNILGVGNCQARGVSEAAAVALGVGHEYLRLERVAGNEERLRAALREAEAVFVSSQCAAQLEELVRESGPGGPLLVAVPGLYFPGFHPDVATPVKGGPREYLDLPMTASNSAILLASWAQGLSASEALTLFRDEVYERLGYYEAFPIATAALSAEFEKAGLELGPFIPRWMESAPFFHIPIHPKACVLRDFALAKLQSFGLYSGSDEAVTIEDSLARSVVWPVYPEIAERLGIAGSHIFRPRQVMPKGYEPPAGRPSNLAPMDLEEFVDLTYQGYRLSPPDLSRFQRLSDPRLHGISKLVRRKKPQAQGNPYKELPPTNWWSRSVGGIALDEVDPVTSAKFTLGRNDRIATAGSCFAQHIARRLASAGFHPLVTERAPADCADPLAEGYGLFTARFGNIYTVRQLLQLARRAYGRFTPAIDAWELEEGGYVDPFRPKIGSAPFDSIAALRSAREEHFAAVREMFETADVFIFTLGLTECWQSLDDDAVVPLPPGALGAKVSASAYVPRNFTVGEVTKDLRRLVALFQKLNRLARIILTVSPVPLIATFEDEHVLSATTYSKSVLRVAAGEIARTNAQVAYFPSYEIITGSFSRGRYFSDDLRQVTEAGVDHVMRSFLTHYAMSSPTGAPAAAPGELFEAEAAAAMAIVCDEEELEE